MTAIRLTRRALLVAGAAASLASAAGAEAEPIIQVSKDAGCPCCSSWIAYLRDEGFSVTETVLEADALAALKLEKAIPVDAQSCHTAEVDGYVVEGHVPAADIRRLLAERPEAVGIVVPGMPFGSPGMGPESRREAYDVLLLRADGTTEIFTRYPAA